MTIIMELLMLIWVHHHIVLVVQVSVGSLVMVLIVITELLRQLLRSLVILWMLLLNLRRVHHWWQTMVSLAKSILAILVYVLMRTLCWVWKTVDSILGKFHLIVSIIHGLILILFTFCSSICAF